MNEITIFDEIGGDGNIVTTLAIQEQLNKIGKVDELLVRINSPGGDVSEGIGIFHVLKNFDAKIVCRIEGIAASAASLIAMAGDRIEMCTGTFLLIHEPHAETIGTSSELTALASDLSKMTKSFAEIYALKSGQSEDFVTQLMAEDRLMSAEEALSLGFCDQIIKNVPAKINMKCLPRFLQRAVKKAKMEKAKMATKAKTRMDTDTNSDNQNTDTDERLDNIEKKIEELTARMDADEEYPDLKPKARGKARSRADDDDDDDEINADDDDDKIDADDDDDDDKIDADDDDDDKIDADDDKTKTVSPPRARAKKMTSRAAYIRGFKRAKKITTLCAIAGCPEKAVKYLDRCMSVAEVSDTLLAQKKLKQNITNIKAYKSAMNDEKVAASWATAIKKISK